MSCFKSTREERVSNIAFLFRTMTESVWGLKKSPGSQCYDQAEQHLTKQNNTFRVLFVDEIAYELVNLLCILQKYILNIDLKSLNKWKKTNKLLLPKTKLRNTSSHDNSKTRIYRFMPRKILNFQKWTIFVLKATL